MLNLLIKAHQAKGQLTLGVLGNWGGDNATQKAVSMAANSACGSMGCSAVLSPGSNFVGGISNVSDDKWANAFTRVYTGSNMTMPFYTTLGKEDWRFNVTAEAFFSQLTYGQMLDSDRRVKGEKCEAAGRKGVSQKAIARAKGAKFTLPNWYYSKDIHFTESSTNPLFGASEKNAIFIFIDTHILSANFADPATTARHWAWLSGTLSSGAMTSDWVIVVGDLPIYSSGKSGGNKEMQKKLLPLLKKHGADAYISGADYDMELMQDGPLMMLNCGNASAAKGKGMRSYAGSVKFSGVAGFCTIKLKGEELFAGFYDKSGSNIYTGSLTKLPRSINPFTKAAGKSTQPANAFRALPWGIGGSIGPNGEGGSMTPSMALFIKVVGTIGLCIYGFVVGVALITIGARVQKCQQK